MKIIVSQHAQKRFRERFKFIFSRYCTGDWLLTRNFIVGQMINARRRNEWKSIPFYRNWMGWKHGINTDIYEFAGVYYICTMQSPNVLVVKTVVKNVMFYKNKFERK